MAGWRQRLQCNRFLYELLFVLCFDRPRAPQPSAGIEALKGCSCPKGLTPMTGYEPGRGKGPSVRRSTHSLSLYLIWRWPRRRCVWQIHVGRNSSLGALWPLLKVIVLHVRNVTKSPHTSFHSHCCKAYLIVHPCSCCSLIIRVGVSIHGGW
jgi:hypothetical protein